MLRTILFSLLRFVNGCIPKSTKKIVFHSFPDLSDSIIALYEYIIKREKKFFEEYEIIWFVDSIDLEKARDYLKFRCGFENHVIYKRLSFKGMLIFFRSRIVVSSHGCFSNIISSNQINFNIWHGMPFKKIGYMLKRNKWEDHDKADVTIALSNIFRKKMSECFNIDEKNVYLVGYPRNDYLFLKNDFLRLFDINKSKYKKVIFWLPTYRKSVVGDIRCDGDENSFGVKDICNEYRECVENILIKCGYLLVIKPHPMDVTDKFVYEKIKNVRIIHNSDLIAKKIQLYELLANSDALITDYSSVFIDYMATGKPLAFITDDMEKYSESRGFVFNPALDYLPGEHIRNIHEFIEYLESFDKKNNQWKDRYIKIASKFNEFRTPDSSKGVFEILSNLLTTSNYHKNMSD